MNAHESRADQDFTPGPAGALDPLLQEIAGREWPGPNRNPRIEEFLMNEVTKKRRSRLGLFLGLGTLLATGAVFGAARLYDQYTVRIQCNGRSTELTAQAGPDGVATIVISMEGGGLATVLVGPDNVEADGQVHVSVDCADGLTHDVASQPAADGAISLDCDQCPDNDRDRNLESNSR